MKVKTFLLSSICTLFLSASCVSHSGDPVAHPQVDRTTKQNIGGKLALYPTPLVVVGAWVNGQVNWILVGHVGIIGHDRILISMSKAHYTNVGIKASGIFSVNIVDESMLSQADYVGSVSGADTDKSHVFAYHLGDAETPLIDAAPLSMECRVEDNYETEGFDNFICSITGTYADPAVLDGEGRIDYEALKPVLFEFPTYSYLRTGDVIGRCRNLGDSAPAAYCRKLPQTSASLVRMARIEVYPQYLDAYRTAAAEVGEASLRSEPGVLTLYATAEQEHPCQITILEIYADSASYQSHLQSAHFLKYKKETASMIRSLKLIDLAPLSETQKLKTTR